jgi:predicted nucleic acid-binding protein
MPTLVDTNILVDLFDAGSPWEDWSTRAIEQQRSQGPIVINQIVYAEMAAGFPVESDLDAALSPARFVREDLPWEAAFAAGHAFLAYRRDGGPKRSPLPDFYIGAHAAIRGYSLLTRDRNRYRAYFPMLRIVAPDTHP